MNFSRTFLFSEFELDEAPLELRRRGREVVLQLTPLRILSLLVAHSTRIVTKSEMLHFVWAGVSVSDAAISTGLKHLRRALGDDGRRQQIIQTLRGRGYRVNPAILVLVRSARACAPCGVPVPGATESAVSLRGAIPLARSSAADWPACWVDRGLRPPGAMPRSGADAAMRCSLATGSRGELGGITWPADANAASHRRGESGTGAQGSDAGVFGSAVTERLGALIQYRLAALSPAAHRVICAAACCAGEFPRALVERVIEGGPELAVRALEEAISAGIIRNATRADWYTLAMPSAQHEAGADPGGAQALGPQSQLTHSPPRRDTARRVGADEDAAATLGWRGGGGPEGTEVKAARATSEPTFGASRVRNADTGHPVGASVHEEDA